MHWSTHTLNNFFFFPVIAVVIGSVAADWFDPYFGIVGTLLNASLLMIIWGIAPGILHAAIMELGYHLGLSPVSRWAITLSSLSGALAMFLLAILLTKVGSSHPPGFWAYPLVGAIAGAVCALPLFRLSKTAGRTAPSSDR